MIYLVYRGSTEPKSTTTPTQSNDISIPQTTDKTETSSPKGVIEVKDPKPGQEIYSPLTVIGTVYGNNGILTIKLKQKESGMYVTEDKVVNIKGLSDNITFAEAIQFGLPVQPQPGIIEVIFQDNSGQGLDDQVNLEIYFPSDLGKGE
ncbi:hypothetical protein HY407_01605 [Candidatus Gottesmanbacteria bacterium]|nr:hypothetical protein [Candidatus Gottesmanbacteria bacterium]